MGERRPYTRGQFNRALIVNAATDTFNVALLAAVLIAGILLGALVYVLPVAAIAYLAGVARTYLDQDVASRVLERERTQRRPSLEDGRRRARPEDFDPQIAQLLEGARIREARIRDAIERAELPYDEVAAEVDRFVVAMDQTAVRAQLLAEALNDTSPALVERRLAALRAHDDPAKSELIDALMGQLVALQRMERQLGRFYAEMERMLIELDTVRSQLISVSASTEGAQQAQLAADMRALRERMGAVADGMSAAYETQSEV